MLGLLEFRYEPMTRCSHAHELTNVANETSDYIVANILYELFNLTTNQYK